MGKEGIKRTQADKAEIGDTSNLGLVGLCHLQSLLPHLDRLQHGGYTLPPTYAHGGKRVLAALSPQQRGGLARDAPAAGTERMTKGNSSTVNIQLVRVYAQILNYRQGLGGEGLIDLYDIHVINGKSGPLQGLAAGGNRSYAHDLRRTPGHGYALNAGQRLQAVLLCIFLSAHDVGNSAICKRGGSPRRHRALLIKGGLQAGQTLQGGVRADAAVPVNHTVAIFDRHNLVVKLP